MKTLSDLINCLDRTRGTIPWGQVSAQLRHFKPNPKEISPHVLFQDVTYHRRRVVRREHYELLILSWKPGQESKIHDHPNSNCWVYFIDGKALEVRYEITGPGLARPVSRQLLRAGMVSVSFDRDDAHKIIPVKPLTTLHLYWPPLGLMNTYEEDQRFPATA